MPRFADYNGKSKHRRQTSLTGFRCPRTNMFATFYSTHNIYTCLVPYSMSFAFS